jgi:DnaJ-class molecular chaperone
MGKVAAVDLTTVQGFVVSVPCPKCKGAGVSSRTLRGQALPPGPCVPCRGTGTKNVTITAVQAATLLAPAPVTPNK